MSYSDRDSLILKAEHLKKVYKKREVVKDVSIEVKRGSIVGLLGPNGAGKTTSFYMIVGMIRPRSGKIFIDDRDISNLPMHVRGRLGITYLPQEKSIFRNLTVSENILSILQYKLASKVKMSEETDRLLEEFGLTKVRNNQGYQLSGGETRRVEIARALASDPAFILLDEPFTGVDPKSIEDLQEIIAQLKDRNIGILITDHNVRETLKITEYSYIMFDGAILTRGTCDELINNEAVKSTYLGSAFDI